MENEKIILITTLKNARNLLNSITCEAIENDANNRVNDIIFKLGKLERELNESS